MQMVLVFISAIITCIMRFEPLEPRHAALMFDELQDPALYAYIAEPRPASLDALEARYARLAAGGPHGEKWLNWIVLDAGAPIGTLQATIYADEHAEVAWLIFPRHWRRGFGAMAAGWLLRHLDELRVLLAEATIDPRNAASLALAAKLGFECIGMRGDDVLVARSVREPDAIFAAWDKAVANTPDKCSLVPHLGALAVTSDRALALLGDALADRDRYDFSGPYNPYDSDSVTRVAGVALCRLGARAEATIAGKLAEPHFGVCVGAKPSERLADPAWFALETALETLEFLPVLEPATLGAIARLAAPDFRVRDAIARIVAKHHVDCVALLDDPATRVVGLICAATVDSHRLVELLRDPSDIVRELAAKQLRRIRPHPHHAAPALIACLDDESWEVVDAAANALVELTPDDPDVTRALFAAARRIPFVGHALLQRSPDQLAALDAKILDELRAKLKPSR
jgi:ribosomal-protein-alanine N-acetyltransferase